MASAPKSSSLTALLFGATGATGKHVLRELLASSHFTTVVEAGRRVNTLPDDTPGKPKLVQKTIDFEKIEQEGLGEVNADVVIITLGTTKSDAGSTENFLKIDRDYVLNAAKAAKTGDEAQRIVYLSSTGASATSRFLYTRSKGETEHGLAKLGYSDLVVFRPGLLKGRDGRRTVEAISEVIVNIIPGRDSTGIDVKELAKSIVRAAETGSAGLPKVADAKLESPAEGSPYHIVANKGSVNLSKLEAA
ncbi:Protein fmp52, mitochondrial [Tulasnella sp. 403]|nr:Protein fmp52, mitochondrial [Tulasnella sp. 403]